MRNAKKKSHFGSGSLAAREPGAQPGRPRASAGSCMEAPACACVYKMDKTAEAANRAPRSPGSQTNRTLLVFASLFNLKSFPRIDFARCLASQNRQSPLKMGFVKRSRFALPGYMIPQGFNRTGRLLAQRQGTEHRGKVANVQIPLRRKIVKPRARERPAPLYASTQGSCERSML